jgi:hypothetical protein
MSDTTPLPVPRRGRPRTGVGLPVQIRLSADQIARLDAWIADQLEQPLSRPEAIRRLLERVLPVRSRD